jgi:RHS repeat-associated protein
VLESRTATPTEADPTASAGLLAATPTTYILGLDVIGQGTSAYYTYDGHGSVRGITDGDGVPTGEYYDYDAFGNAIGFDPNSAASKVLYAGQWWDVAAEGYDDRARIYDPVSGRFTTRDGDYGNNWDAFSLHKYLYANDNPENMDDPTGHDSYATEFGQAVHNAIAADFRKKFPRFAVTMRSIFTIVNVPFSTTIGTLLPDLVYYAPGIKKEVFEIKPDNVRQIVAGYAQLAAYVIALDKIDSAGGWTTGSYTTYTPPIEITTEDPVGFAIVTQLPGGLITYASFQDYAKQRAERTAELEGLEEEDDVSISILDGMLGAI